MVQRRRINYLRFGIYMSGRCFWSILFLLVFMAPHEGDSLILMSAVSRGDRRIESMVTIIIGILFGSRGSILEIQVILDFHEVYTGV